MPFTLNRYGYCYNNGMLMNDLNGMWPNPIKWVKNTASKAVKAAGNAFEFGRNEVDAVGRRCIDFFDYLPQYAVGTSATCLSKIGDEKDPDKEENKECNTNVEKK